MQKAFQYLQTVASSKQEEGKTGKILSSFFFYRGSSSSAGYQNYQQRKQTNVTSYASRIWDGGYINGLIKYYCSVLYFELRQVSISIILIINNMTVYARPSFVKALAPIRCAMVQLSLVGMTQTLP